MVAARQFDVCRVASGGLRRESAVDIAVVMQNDTLSDLATRIVAPLVLVDERYETERAAPAVELDGVRYIVAMHLLATVPARSLSRPVGTLGDYEVALKNAIDMVFFGV